MRYSDVIGQEAVKQRLLHEVGEDRLPHALMLAGPRGAGKMALALTLAQHLLCQHPTEEGCCGECPACRMTELWAHPDLPFTFPIIKRKGQSTAPVCDDYLTPWRNRPAESPYFTIDDWLHDMAPENQQAIYDVPEADNLMQKLALKPSQGGRRVIIMWLPERMNQETANRLLKTIEEPPSRTHFIMVCEQPDKVLGTIISRTQRINVPPLTEEALKQVLIQSHALPETEAATMAHVAQGSYTEALHRMQAGSEQDEFLDLFIDLMRKCYMRDIKAMRNWSDKVAAMGRERQKNLLRFCQQMIRENFIYNFHQHTTLNYQTQRESDFSSRFARFVNERNVIPIMDELSLAERDIESNVNAKMVFFDFALKMIVLLIQ